MMIIIICFLFINCGIVSGSKYGFPCKYSTDCTESSPYSFSSYSNKIICTDERCQCKDERDFHYTTSGNADCENNLISLEFCHQGSSLSSFGSKCPEEQECKLSKCICTNPELFKVGKKCLARNFVKPMAKCFVSDSQIDACDNFGNNTYCRKNKCVCISNHFYNFTSSKCETKKSYTDFHKTSSYKALPRGYCISNIDCVEGLRCLTNYTCDCPRNCSYEEKTLTCDCGIVELEVPMAVLIVGVLFGLFFSICWCCIIKKTVIKYKKKAEAMGMREMTCQDDGSSSSNSVQTPEPYLPNEDPVKITPNVDNPPPYSDVSYPPQPPHVPLASTAPPYPSDPYPHSPASTQPPPYPGSANSTPYPITPSVPSSNNQANEEPYPLNPSMQDGDQKTLPTPYPTSDPPSSTPSYPLAPPTTSAPLGFGQGPPQPDLSFEVTPSLQPTAPSYLPDPK